jgi:hypothetical protein
MFIAYARSEQERGSDMPEWLLIFAGVNLALGAVGLLSPLARRRRTPRRLVLAGVPALWALLMVGSYLYLRATMPPSPVLGSRPDGTLLLRHGNLASIVWQERVSAASVLAFWLTVATLLCLVALWLARGLRRRSRDARFA